MARGPAMSSTPIPGRQDDAGLVLLVYECMRFSEGRCWEVAVLLAYECMRFSQAMNRGRGAESGARAGTGRWRDAREPRRVPFPHGSHSDAECVQAAGGRGKGGGEDEEQRWGRLQQRGCAETAKEGSRYGRP